MCDKDDEEFSFNYRDSLINDEKDPKIPEQINLYRLDGFSLSPDSIELAEQCIESLKTKNFFCNTIDEKTSYISCLSCKFKDSCKALSKIESDLELYEFYLDI